MISPTNSEIKGTLQESPFAELLAEVSQARLSGSFRIARQEEKAIVYLNNGEVVFAVSNLRQHRLYERLLQSNQISKEILQDIPNFSNDMELTQVLISKGIVTKSDVEEIFGKQIKEIIKDILCWETGEWSFSHLARAKEGIQFKVDLTQLILDYARILPDNYIIKRFRTLDERFALRETFAININLLPQESFIFSRLNSTLTKIQDVKLLTGASDIQVFRALYVLWLGNFIMRKNWNSAFSDNQLQQILSAKLTLKKEAITPVIKPNTQTETTTNAQDEVELELDTAEEIDEKRLLEEYLKRIENAHSYYEILDVPVKASLVEIKTAYFKWAKMYHPDKFHQETDTVLQQKVQNAFTEIARAYETLKDDSAREVYDFKLRKYLESVKEQIVPGEKLKPATNVDKAREEFDQGFDYLMNENYEEAAPFLARATQMSPDNARYHAYYGKTLSFVGNQRHKAEAELQSAIKLDANNPSFRIMLAEFYLQYNLLKRAEGELQRLLTQFPDNREAQALLDSLVNK